MTTGTAVEQSAVDPVGTVTDEQLTANLVDRARGDGLKLTGEGGPLRRLTGRVVESALDGGITDHLGYDKHDPTGVGRRRLDHALEGTVERLPHRPRGPARPGHDHLNNQDQPWT